MSGAKPYSVLLAPREGVNDDVVRVQVWLVAEGGRVRENQPVVTLETAKSTFDVEAPADGFLFPLAAEGDEIAVGSALALIAPTPQRPPYSPADTAAPAEAPAGEQVITKKARSLIEEHGLSPRDFAALPVVRASDVEAFLQRRGGAAAAPAARWFRDKELDPAADWDAILQSPDFLRLQEMLLGLRKRLRAKFNRHVPTGTLLHDRWDVARDCRFGEGTSVYDECLILGDVKLGRNCWVGPYTVLDASQAPLLVGDYVDIGTGAHLYTHNTIERALTGHEAPIFGKATTVGNCCFIGPQAIIAPGTVIGDHCFVAAGSYVEGTFPPFSYIAGNPARRVGEIEISGGRARIRRFAAPRAGFDAGPEPSIVE